MWIVAGVLLGVVLLASVAGFHAGPHAHVAAGVAGVLAAFWLVIMAASGHSVPVLWVLLGADLVVALGIGVVGWVGLMRTKVSAASIHLSRLESEDGVALSPLSPEGIVRVRGEQWSALSLNGTVAAGTRVQVVRAAGIRLEVWGERSETDARDGFFELGPDPKEGPP